MNPQHNGELVYEAMSEKAPTPAVEKSAREDGAEKQASIAVEQAHGAPITPPPIQAVPDVPEPDVSLDSSVSSAPSSPGYGPAIADDADLIEKEWVEKAKEIVARTRDDPHLQAKEVHRFRADYIKKRFNKDILVGEE